MKKVICFSMSLALCASSALADSSALPPGKPAGVRAAQDWDLNTTMILSVVALAGAGIGIAASAGNAGGPTVSSTPTSSSTSTATTGTTS